LSDIRAIAARELNDHDDDDDDGNTSTIKPPYESCPVIEVFSESSCSGKTQLLYQMIAESYFSSSHLAPSDGKEIVYIDCDGRFDILRFKEMMRRQTTSDELAEQALSHIHIFRPHSAACLISTLKYIPEYLFSLSYSKPLGTVLVDSISAFYWNDRTSHTFTTIVEELRRIKTMFSATVVLTNNVSAAVNLPLVYNNFVTMRIVMSRDQVAKFNQDIGWLEAWEERETRQEVMDRAGFSGQKGNSGEWVHVK